MAERNHTLTKATAAEVKRRLRHLADMEELFASAEECGIDCQERREQKRYLESQFTKLLEHFAP